MTEMRRVTPDDWPLWRSLRLHALKEAPEAFGSRLADWEDAEEARWRQRLESVPFNVMALAGSEPVGMASGVPEGEEVELISMYVHPSARGRGVGEALVAAVREWARGLGAVRVKLGVRVGNGTAQRLYSRLGFVDVGVARGDPPESEMVLQLR